MILRAITLSLLAFVCSLSSPANAADFQAVSAPDGTNVIVMTGPMEFGDDEAFRKIAAALDEATVVLDSPGGSVVAGMEIGRAIRSKGFSTAVAPDGLCASACALTWLAGAPRYAGPSSHIGFHASYVVKEGAASENGVANALVGAYLNQLNMSQEAIVFVTSAPPEGMEWLTRDKAREVGIGLEEFAADSFLPVADASALNPRSQDPFSTVVAFYDALSLADGEAASALVIPEKRGLGPFNEHSIHSFFSNMTRPLALRSVAVGSDGSVEVSYTYERTNGVDCKGRARVFLTPGYGRLLISRIKASPGC